MLRVLATAAAVTLALIALVGSPPSAAAGWRPAVSVARSDAGTFIADASYRDGLSAITWQVAGDSAGTLHLAISADAGISAFVTRPVADGVVGMAVAACPDDALVAYLKRRADGGLRLRLARVPSAGGSVRRVVIRRSVPAQGSVDVACGSSGSMVRLAPESSCSAASDDGDGGPHQEAADGRSAALIGSVR